MNNWNERIDSTTQLFADAFASLTSEELNWKPDADTWSIAQNIDHLITINTTYFPVIATIEEGNYSVPIWGRVGFVVTFFGKALLRSVQPETKTKVRTFSIWEPSKSEIPEGIVQRFQEHQKELKTLKRNSSDLIERGVVISSPANRNIVYKLETAFEIIVVHEKRHFEQAVRVLKLMKNEAGS